MRHRIFITVAIMLLLTSLTSGVAAQTPEATPSASPVVTGDGWRVADTREFVLDGMPLSLSPDGQWIAGRGPDHQFCVWAVATLEPRCAAPGLPVVQSNSLAWTPDSSAVAFSQLGVGTVPQSAGSDIMVFNVADGVLRNLTGTEDERAQGETGTSRSQPQINVYPVWSPDGDELVFARLEPELEGAAIMRIDRNGGEAETVIADLPALYGPMYWIAGDRIFYATRGPAKVDNGVWVLSLVDGSSRKLLDGSETGEVHLPVLADVSPDGSWFTVWAGSFLGMRENDKVIGVVNSQTGEVQTFGFGPNPAAEPDLLTPPRFSPDGRWLAALLVDGSRAGSSSTLAFWQPGTDGPSIRIRLEHAYAPVTLPIALPWSESDTVLLVGRPGSSGVLSALVTLERDP